MLNAEWAVSFIFCSCASFMWPHRPSMVKLNIRLLWLWNIGQNSVFDVCEQIIRVSWNPWHQLILLWEVRRAGVGATPPGVTSIWPERCNNPTNLPIIAARLGTCHQGTTDPQSPKINTSRPSGGDPATQGDVNTVDWVLKNISSARVTARGRERERGSVCGGVAEGACGCPGWPVGIKPPGEVPRWCAIPPEYRQAPWQTVSPRLTAVCCVELK